MEVHKGDSFVEKFSLKPYDGGFRGSIYRIRSLMWFDIRERMVNQLAFIILYVLNWIILLMIVLPLIFGFMMVPGATLKNEIADMIGFVIGNPFIFIALAVVGGGLISENLDHLSLESYLTRISRHEYAIAKILTVIVTFFVILVLPSLFYFFELSAALGTSVLTTDTLNIEILNFSFNYPAIYWDDFELLVKTLLYILLCSVIFGGITLGISSLTQKRMVSVIVIILFYFIGIILPSILWILDEPVLQLLNIANYDLPNLFRIILGTFEDEMWSIPVFFLDLNVEMSNQFLIFLTLSLVTIVGYGIAIYRILFTELV